MVSGFDQLKAESEIDFWFSICFFLCSSVFQLLVLYASTRAVWGISLQLDGYQKIAFAIPGS